MVFFRGGQIRSRHRYEGWAKILTFRQIRNATITLSAPEVGGKLHCQLRWGGSWSDLPSYILHCLRLNCFLKLLSSEYLVIHCLLTAPSFSHSLNAISIVHLLPRGASDTARILCRSFTPKRNKQLRVKDLPKVPTWRQERDSKPRPSSRKASSLPMRHHAPQYDNLSYSLDCLITARLWVFSSHYLMRLSASE